MHAIVGAGDPLIAAERDRLARLSQVLAVPIEKPVPPGDVRAAARPRASRGAASRGPAGRSHRLAGWHGRQPAVTRLESEVLQCRPS